ncbi:MAG: diaminopimelate epimerase [Bacteroidetes bacterium]|nr:diaminopimelate epimerase [Bacteroidota bacterium]
MKIDFYKYQGTGNDFIILDNRNGEYSAITNEMIKRLCERRIGIGADGLMLFESQDGFDFKMIYFNSDGLRGTMCGNGGRCMTQFAYDIGLTRFTYRFIASDGPHEAEITTDGIIRLKMSDVSFVEEHGTFSILDTGSPHYVKFVNDLSKLDVVEEGREIRNSKRFIENGINVDFVEVKDDGKISIRTYERGVEDETLSCGTGVTAAAIACSHNPKGFNRIEASTPGGQLSVEYNKIDEQHFSNIWLCGPAEFVFKGSIDVQY